MKTALIEGVTGQDQTMHARGILAYADGAHAPGLMPGQPTVVATQQTLQPTKVDFLFVDSGRAHRRLGRRPRIPCEAMVRDALVYDFDAAISLE